jgi:hypothetical protein
MPIISSVTGSAISVAAAKVSSSSSSSAGLPVAGAQLWFDGSDLASLSDGANITVWPNKGSLGAGYNLVNTTNLGNSAGTTYPPPKQSISSKPCAYFNGSSNYVLYFKNWQDSPGSTGGVYYFDGDSNGNTTPQARTMFYVYYTTSNVISAFGTYSGNYSTSGYGQSYSNVGFAYNGYYNIVESNDGFPIGSGTGQTVSTSSISQAGHSQDTGSTVYVWYNKTGSLEGRSYSNAGAQVHPSGMGFGRSSTYNNGYIFEVIVYGRTLDTSEITSVRNYLGAKYGQNANN